LNFLQSGVYLKNQKELSIKLGKSAKNLAYEDNELGMLRSPKSIQIGF